MVLYDLISQIPIDYKLCEFLARIEEKIKAEAEIDAYEEGRRNRGDNMRQQRLPCRAMILSSVFVLPTFADRRQAGKRLVHGQRPNDNPELRCVNVERSCARPINNQAINNQFINHFTTQSIDQSILLDQSMSQSVALAMSRGRRRWSCTRNGRRRSCSRGIRSGHSVQYKWNRHVNYASSSSKIE